MSMNQEMHTRSRATRWLAALLAGFVLTLSLPMLAFAQAASEPAATAPAAAPAAAPAVAMTEEAIENPYGLQALWGQGDYVAKGTLVILVIMSMGS